MCLSGRFGPLDRDSRNADIALGRRKIRLSLDCEIGVSGVQCRLRTLELLPEE
jgi:hypothetical protein